MSNMCNPVLGKQAAEREQIIIDRLKEYANGKEYPMFHVGDAKRLCSEFYEDEVQVAFHDLRNARLFEVVPGYHMTSPIYYRFVGHKYPKKCNPLWLITIRYKAPGYDHDKIRFRREVKCDGKDYSLDILGMYKLGNLALKAYIQTARDTNAFPDMRFYWNGLLKQREGFYRHDEGYYTQSRGDFEVRLEEVNPS